MIRDTAMVLLANFSGFHESKVRRLERRDINELTEDRYEVVIRFWKLRTSDEAVRRGPMTYTHLKVSRASPLYIIVRYV